LKNVVSKETQLRTKKEELKMNLRIKRAKPLIAALSCVLMACMLLVNVPASYADHDTQSVAAPSLVVKEVSPDGTKTTLEEYEGTAIAWDKQGNPIQYSYPELEAIAEPGNKRYATIDAYPAGVSTLAHGVTIEALAQDTGATWESGRRVTLYPMDAVGYPYQGTYYYSYDRIEDERYYYPHLVECFTNYQQSGDPDDLEEAYSDGVPVEPMLALSSFQARWKTDSDLYDYESSLDALDSMRFCMGLTLQEAQNGVAGSYSSTNKFCKWIYEIDFGPMNGQTVIADTTDNLVGQEIDMTFTDKAEWRNAITGIKVDNTLVGSSHYTITAGNIHFDNTVFTSNGNHIVVIEAAGFMDANVTQPIGRIAPQLNADTSNNALGEPIDITFTENYDWRQRISSVTINGNPVTNYNKNVAGKLTFPASNFTATGDYTIAVNTTGYDSASVTQSILLAYPGDIQVDGVRVGDQVFTLAFTDNPAWRAAIYDIIVGGRSVISYCDKTQVGEIVIDGYAAQIHGVGYDLVIKATGYPDAVKRLAPAITPDSTENGLNQTSASNGGIVLTYTNHPLLPSYNDAITDVWVGNDSIAGHYTKTSGSTITIDNSVFTTAGTYVITVFAEGYLNATTVQTICPLGDINFDGIINDTDVDLAINYVLEIETPSAAQFIAADINADGVIDDLDIYYIMELAGY